MIKAAVLGSPISHSLSPILHKHAYSLLKITGDYAAIDIPEARVISFLEESVGEDWSGFNLTMPLKERVFNSPLISFDERATRIKSANTLIRMGDRYLGTSTDLTAFERLLEPYPVEKVALIGAGGTARALIGAIAHRTKRVDVLLRTAKRLDLLSSIAPNTTLTPKEMNSSLEGYDLVVNTTPAGAADHLAASLRTADGILLEALYKPWPTELSFAWSQLGGRVVHGVDLLVEQALDAIHLIAAVDFDYGKIRTELLNVALSELTSQ